MPPSMRLGEYRSPAGGSRVARAALPARPAVVEETVFRDVKGRRFVERVELVPVWYPHRDAASLQPEGDSRPDSLEARGHLAAGARLPRWSWLG